MEYVDYKDYSAMYGRDKLTESEFPRYRADAMRLIDLYTTGIDDVQKLKVAFPTDENDIEAVKLCTCKLIDVLRQIDAAESGAEAARGYTATENGLQGNVITSKSAGNESISYSTTSNSQSAVDKAVSDPAEKKKLICGIVTDGLRGVCDANGVHLLNMGRYPQIRG